MNKYYLDRNDILKHGDLSGDFSPDFCQVVEPIAAWPNIWDGIQTDLNDVGGVLCEYNCRRAMNRFDFDCQCGKHRE